MASKELKNENTSPAVARNEIKFQELLRELSRRLGPNWEPLATYLGIAHDNITTIKTDNLKIDEQIFAMLMVWNRQIPSQTTTLSKALNSIGRKDLANAILRGEFMKQCEEPVTTAGKKCVSVTKGLTDVELRSLASNLAGDWKRLATYLGISSERTGKIQHEYRGVQEQVFQMLIFWRNGSTSTDPRGDLRKALKDIGRNDLAGKCGTCTK